MGILSDIQAAFDAVANEREYTGGDSPARYLGGVGGSLYKNLVKEPVRSFGLMSGAVDKAWEGQPINLTEDIQTPLLDWGMIAAPVGMMTMPKNSLGIFSGKMANTADHAALREAQGMLPEFMGRDDLIVKRGGGGMMESYDDVARDIASTIREAKNSGVYADFGLRGEYVDNVGLKKGDEFYNSREWEDGSPIEGSNLGGVSSLDLEDAVKKIEYAETESEYNQAVEIIKKMVERSSIYGDSGAPVVLVSGEYKGWGNDPYERIIKDGNAFAVYPRENGIPYVPKK